MPLNKQNVQISFSTGIDTKTDPKQVQGKLLLLENAVFQTGMELRKRNGNIALPALSAGVGIATFNDELVSLDGSSLFSYDAANFLEINKGSLPTTSLSTKSIIRNSTQQTTPDSAINGALQAFCWSDSAGQLGYSIIDTETGQSIVNNAQLAAITSAAKVLSLGSNFVFIYYSAGSLFYKTVSTSNPLVLSSATLIANDIAGIFFDATVFNSRIYLVYGSTVPNTASLFYLTSALVLSSKFSVTTTSTGSAFCIIGDASNNAWVAYGFGSGPIRVFIANPGLTATVLADTLLDVGPVAFGPQRITGIVTGTTGKFWYEIPQFSGFISIELSPDYIRTNTMTLAGVAGTPTNLKRGVGLASKAFVYKSVTYFLASFESDLQSTYFLLNDSGQVVLKLSPSLGGGYSSFSLSLLPEVNLVSTGVYEVASLIKDLISSTNGVIITQTGVLSATMSFTTIAPSKVDIGENLLIAGGILSMYDGGAVVEHGYSIYPEGLQATLSFDPCTPGFLGSGAIGLGTNNTIDGQVQYSAVYTWTDNQGQIEYSAPSVPITQSLTTNKQLLRQVGGITVTNGSPSISGITGDLSQVSPGQYVTVFGNELKANLVVSSVSTGSITLTGNFLGGSSMDESIVVTSNPVAFALELITDIVVGANSITVSNADMGGLFVGQIINSGQASNSPGGDMNLCFPVGTYIKQIFAQSGSRHTIVFSENAVLPGPTGVGFWFYSLDTASIAIKVPTLKLTQKKGVLIGLYRTQVDGTIFFLTTSAVALTPNDSTVDYITISDTLSDLLIIGNQQIYTTGGVLENIEVPAVNSITSFKSRAIALIPEQPLSWWYSKQVVPGVPVEFSDSFVNNIDSRIKQVTAAYALDDKIIFFGPTSIFYVVGDGPTANGLNNTFTDAQLVTSDVGCSNQASIVLMPFGLMFKSAKGIYLLDRSLAVQYIGADVESSNDFDITSAQLMNSVNQVRFTLSNGTELVYDYYYKQWDVFAGLSANDSVIFQEQHTFINSNGDIWQEAPGVFSDDGAIIPFHLVSNWLSFANIQGFQRIYSFLALGEWKSPHTITINIYSSFGGDTPTQTTVIPFLTEPTVYQYRVFMNALTAKNESIKIEIIESQDSPGEGFSLSNMAFIVGVKTGLNKLPASKSYS